MDKVEMLDLRIGKWETLPDMNDVRNLIRDNVCFIDGHAYVAGGSSQEKAEKFHYGQQKWVALPNYPIKDELRGWSSALTFTRQEIQQETIKNNQGEVLFQAAAPQDVIENFIRNSAMPYIDMQSTFQIILEFFGYLGSEK